MKELIENMLSDYDNNELLILRENIIKYIVDLDFNEIKWSVLNVQEMEQFFYNNYYNDERFVSWKHLGEESSLGMCYLYFPPYEGDFKFFVGSIKNNIDKETIIGCIIYKDNWKLNDETELFTLILTVEINYFYQGLGLLNVMFKNFGKVINQNQNIVMTNESHIGSICHVMDHLKKNLYDINFQKQICFAHEMEDNYYKRKCKSMNE